MGFVMIDLAGFALTPNEAELIRQPVVGGVILFTRNFQSTDQLSQLVASLHALKSDLIVAVDHEGGRVQRFRQGFTVLPPMTRLGVLFDRDPQHALRLARSTGIVLAAELRRFGIDLSFTPVLDLNWGHSTVIGDRSFHRDPQAVAALAQALCQGLHAAGLKSVGKHFPGHGYVEADSHFSLPVDPRDFDTIDRNDLEPYRRLIPHDLDAVMPAHVSYSAVDETPAGFSAFWLQRVLRESMGFDGVIFSDDLSMKGALHVGNPVQRALAALGAGCDMVLLCNDPAAASELVAGLAYYQPDPKSLVRLSRLLPESQATATIRSAAYREAHADLEGFLAEGAASGASAI